MGIANRLVICNDISNKASEVGKSNNNKKQNPQNQHTKVIPRPIHIIAQFSEGAE